MRFGFAILLVTSVAAADPKPDKAVLERAATLSAAGKHKEAVAAYETYLANDPDNAIANAELGWSAFQLKDYKKAEEATRRAIKNSKDPGYRTDPTARPKGAALYNLGLILDAQGKRADAVAALAESLAVRPNRVVREKLLQLDAAREAAVDPLKPTKMAGPFASRYDKCENCSPSPAPGKAVLAKPFEAVEVVQKWHAMEIAVQVSGTWYRSEWVGPLPCGATASQLVRAAVVTRGKTAQLEIDFTAKATCSSMSGGHTNDWRVDTRNTMVIGVGMSGVPSATPPITWSLDAMHQLDGEDYNGTKAAGKVTWTAGGVLDLVGKFDSVISDPGELGMDDLAGKHALAFP